MQNNRIKWMQRQQHTIRPLAFINEWTDIAVVTPNSNSTQMSVLSVKHFYFKEIS